MADVILPLLEEARRALAGLQTPELWCLLQRERDTLRRQGDNHTDTPYLSNIEAE
jgi:hypothetical protein